jgi:hypothetical protein
MMKYTSKDGKVKIECDTENTRLMDYMRDQLMAQLHQEWRDFMEEVAVTLRKSKPGEKFTLYSKPIEVVIENKGDGPGPE